MHKLYGFRVSNYYNMVKLALLKKGIAFEEVDTMPSADEDFLQKSPMGKVPCLEANGRFLTETNVILEYLEDTSPAKPLYPADAFARAQVREVMKEAELYIELVGRQLYPNVFFGEELTPALREKVRPELEKGAAAIARRLSFSPYAAGAEMSNADIMLYYSLTLVAMAAQSVYDFDLVAAIPGSGAWLGLMEQDASVQQVNVERDAAMAAFMAAMQAG